jgi:hypothetical protein
VFRLPFPRGGEESRLSTHRGRENYDINMIATSGTTSRRAIPGKWDAGDFYAGNDYELVAQGFFT